MAKPYIAVIGNICSGKSTFVKQFSASQPDWYCLPEILDERQRNSLRGPDLYYVYASFFADFYINRHLFSRTIPGPMMQESCLESSSLFPRVYYECDCFTKEKCLRLESKYAEYQKKLPRPDFYIYLHTPMEVLLARAEIRKEPARTVSKLLLPRMQYRLDEWVERHVRPDRLLKITSQDVDMVEIRKILDELPIPIEHPGNHSLQFFVDSE